MNLKFKINSKLVMIIPKDFYGLLLFCLIIFNAQTFQDACESKETLTTIDISASRIQRTTVYEYKVQNFDCSTNLTRNQKGQLVLRGNFSRLTLLNNALGKQYTYAGKQMIIRVPSIHYYARNKSAEAELQIIYELEGRHDQNRHKVVTMTQLYLVTKFLSRVEINLCIEINKETGSNFKTSKLLKIIEKMPILMYQGAKNIYPCRNDILCMVRKQFALISEQDLACLTQKMNIETFKNFKKTKFNQKSLLQVSQIQQKNDL